MTTKTFYDVMFAKNPKDLKKALDNYKIEPVTDDQEYEIVTEFVADIVKELIVARNKKTV